MGICTNTTYKRKEKKETEKLINHNKNNNSNNENALKGNIQNKNMSAIEGITKASSESSNLHHNVKPEIYSIEKFGVKINPNQELKEPLKFIFHFYNFKCKMLPENTIYIMHVIFDGKEYPLSFGYGDNPSFIFDEFIGKEILFNKMSSSYMEINLYTHKSKSNNAQTFKNMTKGEILAGTQIFSCLKIDLLTLALAPEKHDLVLLDPNRNRVNIGRINYNLTCKQVEDITIKIKSFKIILKNMNFNEIALNLKYENISLSLLKETEYTDNFHGNPNIQENSMTYKYLPNDELIPSKSNSNEEKNEKELYLNDKIESKEKINEKTNDIIFFDDTDEYDNISTSEKLKLHGKMSLNDILNSDITLNIFSVRLKSRNELDKINDNNINLNYIPHIKNAKISKKPIESKNFGLFHKKLDLIKTYTLIGIVSLNFYKILSMNENKIEREASKFFHSLSTNKYDELNKTISNSKINSVGVEQNLNEKNNKKSKEEYIIQNLIISVYENIKHIFVEDIFNYDGESIGNIEMCIEINKLPIIKQAMFGVLTETGFEINSVFLYDNNNISNDLPEALLELIKLKEKFQIEISTNIQQFDYDKNILNIMQNMKSLLEKTIEKNILYYGYSSDKDKYQAQEIIIDLGLILFELLEKFEIGLRKIGFEILKLILKRSEIDLGTLSVIWFKTIKKSIKINLNNINNKNNNIYDFEIRDNYLLERGIIEKFFKFHLEALNFSLDNLKKGNYSDNISRNFTYYYLSISYFLNPTFRDKLIKEIYTSVNFKDTKYIKNIKNNIMIFNDDNDNLNKAQNNFILWDISFYKKLEISLNKYNFNKNNNYKKYIKNVNSIKEQISEIKYIINENDKVNLTLNYQEHNWINKIKSRGLIFYDYILELITYIQQNLNKIDENNINTKWTNIPGINKIIEVINYDLIIKDAINYPKQIYEILPLFYSEVNIINHFIYSMIITTKIYDTESIHNMLNILEYLFNKVYEISNYTKNNIKDKIDYKIIKNSFFTIVNTDNSLAIAKYILFYYKNISVLSTKHVNKIIVFILRTNFFKLFFHWSFQIREIFYTFLIYIINYKIKNLIKPNKQYKKTQIGGSIPLNFKPGIFGFKNSFEINDEQNFDDKKNFYYFGDLLNEKMKILDKIINIVDKEKYDLIYKNIFDKNKYKYIIKDIPEEYYSNIIVGIYHYKKIINEFKEWDKNNKENKIEEKNEIYPNKEIITRIYDTIEK